MKFGFLIFCLIIFSCKQKDVLTENKQELENLVELETIEFKSQDPDYLKNPDVSDTMCINSIKRARKDLELNAGIFVEAICFGCKSQIYLDELKEVLKRRNFKFVYEDFGCVIFEGQTQGCYSGFVDLEMKKKFGESIFESIHKEAEDLFIKNVTISNKTVSEYDLEEKNRPQSLIQDDYISEEILILHTNIPVSIWSHESLFLDLNFVVEKDGSLNGFEADNWVIDAKENEKYKNELFNFTIAEIISKYNKWKPANYKGNKIRSQKNLRVHYRKLY